MKIFLELFLVFFTLKSFVVAGNAHPLTDFPEEDFSKNNNKMKRESLSTLKSNTAASITPYTCVYVPSDLDHCDFVNFSHHKSNQNRNLVHKLLEKKKYKLLKSNAKVYLPHSTTHVPKMKKVLKSTKIIIYEIKRCVPSRLPFNLPWCTDEDLSNKKNEIRELYPFASGVSKPTYEFPTRDFLNAI